MTNEITATIPYHKFHRIMHRYVRDCLQDTGTAVQICAEDVKAYWHQLDSQAREDIEREIKFFMEEHDREFFAKDLAVWSELSNWIAQNRHQPQKTESENTVVLPVVNRKFLSESSQAK